MKHSAIKIEDGISAEPDEMMSSVRVPHLNAAAFCVTPTVRGAIERASQDRRLTRVKTEISNGGVERARQVFAARQTPSLLVVEVASRGALLLKELEILAEVCDPTTKVVVIGPDNDIGLYRTLMGRGVADYLVGTITPLSYVSMVQNLFGQDNQAKLGKVYAFVGAKGGVGASTLAQNVAWTIAQEQATPTLLVDLDFRFGSAAVNLDLKLVTGLEKYLSEPDKLDAALLDKLIVQRGEHLSVLPAFDDSLGGMEPAADAVDRLIEIARASFPNVVLDLPHDWSPASRDTLTAADKVIVVAAPDLPNLHNTMALMDRLHALRPNDAPPQVILNMCKMPKRKEIGAQKFAKSLGVENFATIAFDPGTFGSAAFAGRALSEHSPRSKAQKSVRELATSLSGKDKTRSRNWLLRTLGLG
ncbi:MAG: CpaE family protein [Pelagibaca sp.]